MNQVDSERATLPGWRVHYQLKMAIGMFLRRRQRNIPAFHQHEKRCINPKCINPKKRKRLEVRFRFGDALLRSTYFSGLETAENFLHNLHSGHSLPAKQSDQHQIQANVGVTRHIIALLHKRN